METWAVKELGKAKRQIYVQSAQIAALSAENRQLKRLLQLSNCALQSLNNRAGTQVQLGSHLSTPLTQPVKNPGNVAPLEHMSAASSGNNSPSGMHGALRGSIFETHSPGAAASNTQVTGLTQLR